jgi:class 3 adenylate cyclase/pimeloyl-ACP methyl ester carboxylesterase
LAAIMAADAVGYSRMMREDESAAFALLLKHRSEVIDPTIGKHRGRTVKLMGDGLLAEFSSVVEGVSCATEIQRAMSARNAGAQLRGQMPFRVGLHLGDVVVEGDDLYGDGVNIAARLESIAQPGGICISRQAYDQVHKKLVLGYRNLGPQKLKNIPEPIEVFAIQGDGLAMTDERQEIRYCRTADGVRLAYAISGQGPPLVKTGNFLDHLEYDWDSPIWRHLFLALSRKYRLCRYDPRGTGLSDWDVADISLEAWVNDLAVVADAAGLDRFPVFGLSQGCAVSIAYAVQNPDRVSHLILCGGFALGGGKRGQQERERRQALATLMRLEWGADNSGIRQMFANYLMPDATKQEMDSFGDLQRRTVSADSAARYFEASSAIDVVGLLSQVRAPTLVMHARGDRQIPFELGRQLAAEIPGAKFVALQSNNHSLLEHDPATRRVLEEIALFLGR